MTTTVRSRRKVHRYPLPSDLSATITFAYPGRDRSLEMPLHDLSVAGISFIVSKELSMLEPGQAIPGVRIRILGRDIRGDMVIMHVTPDGLPGSICGALFYPEEDEDLLALADTVAELDRLE